MSHSSSLTEVSAARSSVPNAPMPSSATLYGPCMHSSPMAPIGCTVRKATPAHADALTWPARSKFSVSTTSHSVSMVSSARLSGQDMIRSAVLP
jgi:hypothetical protein